MPKALTITRRDFTAEELREAAVRSTDADAARRMLGLALVLDGYQRGEAANLCGMDRQTLRDWVIRYNAEGVAGLSDRISPGPKPRLSAEQEAIVAELVRQGPDLATDGVVRWRRVDLARVIKTRFNVTLAERSVGALLRRLGFRRLSVRPRHPKQDKAAQETHKKTLPISSPPRSPNMHAKSPSNFGGKMKPGWVSKALWPASGPSAAAARPHRAINAANGPIYSAPSVRIAIGVRPWFYLMPMRKR
jgi:transposase